MIDYERELELQRQFEDDPELVRQLFNANENRDKLLSYDNSDIARKNIYDEEKDWY
jgi:hypothetical protein